MESDLIKTTIKAVNVCAIWTYNTANDTCSLCKNKMTEKCLECQKGTNVIEKNCPLAKGRCEHGYHYHCIEDWLSKGSRTCPQDQSPWIYTDDNLEASEIKSVKQRQKYVRSKHR